MGADVIITITIAGAVSFVTSFAFSYWMAKKGR